jgi:ubiquinone biosynthesis protein
MRDTKKIVEILVKLKIIVPTTTDTSEIETFFEYVLGYMETLDVTNFSANDELLAELARKKPFVVPSSFVYLAKTFSTVEGLCLKLDPEFNYFNYLEPIIKKQVSSSVNIGDMLTTTAEMPSRIKAISTAVLGLEKSKAAMKRSIDKTRRQIRYAQYAVLSAVLSQYFDDKQHVSMIFILITAWFTFQKSR